MFKVCYLCAGAVLFMGQLNHPQHHWHKHTHSSLHWKLLLLTHTCTLLKFLRRGHGRPEDTHLYWFIYFFWWLTGRKQIKWTNSLIPKNLFIFFIMLTITSNFVIALFLWSYICIFAVLIFIKMLCFYKAACCVELIYVRWTLTSSVHVEPEEHDSWWR